MPRTSKLNFNLVVATLCLALTLMVVVFQSVTIASRFAHDREPAHSHGVVDAPLLVAEIEHSDHHPDESDDDHDAKGPVGGAHHHHADGVGSFVNTWSEVVYSARAGTVQLAATGDATPRDWAPDSLERPPRPLTSRI